MGDRNHYNAKTPFQASARGGLSSTNPTVKEDTEEDRHSHARKILGLHNTNDMFLDDIGSFLDHYGPRRIEDSVIEECIDGMVSQKLPVLLRTGDQLEWAKHARCADDISTSGQSDDFIPLGVILQNIVMHSPIKSPSGLYFRLCKPNLCRQSNSGKGMYSIEGCLTNVGWMSAITDKDIFLPIKWEEGRSWAGRVKAHEQILGACHHIVNEDARRMWIYGLTFENDMVSIWYFSRCHSVKTIAVNWIADPRMLVKILLVFSTAEPTALGFHPLVHLCPSTDTNSATGYVYQVSGALPDESPVFYKTGHSRRYGRAERINDRVTRVWEVTRVTSFKGDVEYTPAEKVILKDVWIDANKPTEGENLDQIFKAIDNFVAKGLEVEILKEVEQHGTSREAILSDESIMARLMRQFIDNEKRFAGLHDDAKERLRVNLSNKHYKALFLTKLYEWKGETTRTVSKTARHFPRLFPKYFDAASEVIFHQTVAPQSRCSDSNSHVELVPKQQIRLVYKEVCETVDTVSTVGEAVDVLCQTLDALCIIHAVGWVHRDISPGNILILPKKAAAGEKHGWSMKLADFEFARLMLDPDRKPRSDPRTGTALFMPTEILRRRYFFDKFYSPPADDPFPDSDADATDTTLLSAITNASSTPLNLPDEARAVLSSFKDLFAVKIPEDAMWTQTTPHGSPVNHNYQHDLESVWWILLWLITMNVDHAPSTSFGQALFQYDVDQYGQRFETFTEPMKIALTKCLKPELATLFPSFMDGLRAGMYRSYVTRPIFGHLNHHESYAAIRATFASKFDTLRQMGGNWRPVAIDCKQRPTVFKIEEDRPVDVEAEAGTQGTKRRHGTIAEEPEETVDNSAGKKAKRNDK